MNPSRLDSLIARARELDVKPDHARAYVADLDRWARREGTVPARRWPAFVAGFAIAAALAAIAFWWFLPDPKPSYTVAITLPLPIASAAPIDAGEVGEIDALAVVPTPPPPPVPADATRTPVHAVPPDADIPAPPPDAGSQVTDRWHLERQLRTQGKFTEAVTECEAIADTHDATWAPIALVEAARIELGPLAAPERAITYVERFEREWPSNGLLPEARDLRCRALKQLGRECGH